MITHPEKILLPDEGITNGEMAKGFHIVVPPCASVGAEMVRRQPGFLTQEFSKADRSGLARRCRRRARGEKSRAAA